MPTMELTDDGTDSRLEHRGVVGFVSTLAAVVLFFVKGQDMGVKFTDREKELLRKHLDFYKDLDRGFLEPTTKAQQHFVYVCRGHFEASTEHEIAYKKYRRAKAQADLKKKSKQQSETSDSPNPDDNLPYPGWKPDKGPPVLPKNPEDVQIPEYEDGYPDPTWYPGRDNSRLSPYGKNSYKRD